MKYLPFALLLISFGACAATTLYKSVDEQGNITYSDAPPGDARDVEEIDIKEGNMNVLPSEDVQKQIERQKQQDKQAADRQRADNQDWQQRYEEAQAELTAAEQTLESAREIQEGDTVGSAYGGARPNADWIERLERAEADVVDKQQHLHQVKRQRR
jgi:hypothetical protein